MAIERIVIFHHDERGAVRTWSEIGELVRCKDCKHYLDGGCGNVGSQSPSKKLMGVKPDWYCADGERREDDGNDQQ